jgi:hypothetical protein
MVLMKYKLKMDYTFLNCNMADKKGYEFEVDGSEEYEEIEFYKNNPDIFEPIEEEKKGIEKIIRGHTFGELDDKVNELIQWVNNHEKM